MKDNEIAFSNEERENEYDQHYCHQCSFTSYRSDVLEFHKKWEHSKDEFFQCSKCVYKCKELKGLNDHCTTYHFNNFSSTNLDNHFPKEKCSCSWCKKSIYNIKKECNLDIHETNLSMPNKEHFEFTSETQENSTYANSDYCILSGYIVDQQEIYFANNFLRSDDGFMTNHIGNFLDAIDIKQEPISSYDITDAYPTSDSKKMMHEYFISEEERLQELEPNIFLQDNYFQFCENATIKEEKLELSNNANCELNNEVFLCQYCGFLGKTSQTHHTCSDYIK